MLKPFVIHEPRTPQQASELLNEYGWDATVYAGGTELLVVMKEGLASYAHLINIKTISDIHTIHLTDNDAALRIGAAVTHRAIETSSMIAAHAPLLIEMERSLANVRVRTMGTLAGNLCFAEPHSDPAAVCMAWPGASFELTSTDGVRQVLPDEFFIDLFMTARQENEIMTAIHLPLLPPGMGSAYHKFVLLERPSVSVAAFVSVAGTTIKSAHIAVGSVGPVPYRATAAENMLLGQTPGDEPYRAAAEAAASAADPVGDLYGSVEYKRQLIRVLTRQALQQASERAMGVERL
ncbi:MAG: FAD binding domain-containing protein [Anaerolineaceae bacterium]|nr:FAD binding domain-containing protein [Anaerolineaceae bacterium]